jgi:hypothetical protein
MKPHKQPGGTAQLGDKDVLGVEKEQGLKGNVVKGENGNRSEAGDSGLEDGGAKRAEAKRDLWDEAYKALRQTDEKLVGKYEDILFNFSGESCLQVCLLNILLMRIEHVGVQHGDYPQSSKEFAPVGETDRQTQLSNLLNAQTDYIEKNRLEIKVAGHSFGVRKAVYKVAKLVGVAKDFIGKALPNEPHCQLAWAGVCLLLPVSLAIVCRCIVTPKADPATQLLLNPEKQDAAAANGLDVISGLILRYRVIELTFKKSRIKNKDFDALLVSIEGKTVNLYTAVLRFEILLVAHLHKNAVVQDLRNIITLNNWEKLGNKIEGLDQKIRLEIDSVDSKRIQGIEELQEDIWNTTRHLETQIDQMLDLLYEQKKTHENEERDAWRRMFSTEADGRTLKDRWQKREPGKPILTPFDFLRSSRGSLQFCDPKLIS